MADKLELAKAYIQIVPTTMGMKTNLSNMMNGDAEEAGKEAGEKAGGGISEGIKKVGGTITKVAGAAIVAGAAAVGKIATDAISNYADYEQLVGGVETLFKDSAKTVQAYAQNAYKTAGLSANDYMETVTGFSASLLQSLDGDTELAAEVANKAISDMSDNANKMGSDMSSIQNAYAGFAKQNYTMLDNLKLGYGGTKSEMERLIKDANALKEAQGEVGALTIESYADVIEAIHMVQDEMEITGTTALEAGTTISGSLTSVKATWENLLTGMMDGEQDLGPLVENLVTSLVGDGSDGNPGFLGLVVPRLLEGLPRLVEGLSDLFEQLVPYLPGMIEQVLPGLLEAGTMLVTTLIENLPMLIQPIAEALPGAFTGIADSISTCIDSLTEKLTEALPGFTRFFEDVQEVASGVSTFFTGVFAGDIDTALQGAGEALHGWYSAQVSLLDGIATYLQDFFLQDWTQVFGNDIGEVLNVASGWIAEIIGDIKNVFAGVIDFIDNVFAGNWKAAWESIKNVFKGIWDTFIDIVKAPLNGIIWLVNGMIGGINACIDGLNTLSWDVPDWVPFVGGQHWGFNIGRIGEIPYLAQGGVLEKGQTGFLEGTGAEAVVPLENNAKWISAVADDLQNAVGGGSIGEAVSEIRDLMAELKNMSIVLDTGEIVGGLSGGMDERIGVNSVIAGRAVAL